MNITHLVYAFGVGRIALGLAPIVAARPASNLLGFPRDHDNPTTRLMARLFGVRDIGLGVLAIAAVQGLASLPFVFLFQAAHDLGDAMMISAPLVKRQGIDRAAATSLAFALIGASLWIGAWSFGR